MDGGTKLMKNCKVIICPVILGIALISGLLIGTDENVHLGKANEFSTAENGWFG